MQTNQGVPQLEINDILAIENTPDVFNFIDSESEIPLWPEIRILFFRQIISDYIYSTQFDTGGGSAPPFRMVGTMMWSIFQNALWNLRQKDKTTDLCIFSSAIGHQVSNGRTFNRLSDSFALSIGRSLTVEDHSEWRRYNNRVNASVLYHSPFQAVNTIRGLLNRRSDHISQARDLVELVSARAKSQLGWKIAPSRKFNLIHLLANKTASLPGKLKTYSRLFKKLHPKTLMVLGGCYGPSSSIITTAKRLGIPVCEFQHGAVSSGHDAYNFAPEAARHPAMLEALPDFFLGYGNWWNTQINAPIQKIAIGNPYRENRISCLPPAESKNTILILSDGVEFGKYLALAQRIEAFALGNGLRLCIRPHPLERTKIVSQYGTRIQSIEIEATGDIYKSFSNAYAVISEISTGLFEAVGLVENIFMWDTPKSRFGFPQHPFCSFVHADDLICLLEAPGAGSLAHLSTKEFWEPAWQDRFTSFVDGLS